MSPTKTIFFAACLSALAGCTLGIEDDCGNPHGCGWESDAWYEWPDAGPFPVNDAMPIVEDGGGIVPDAPSALPDAAPVDDDAGGGGEECSSITVEAVCVVLPECQALYEGIGCVCDEDGVCTCEGWEFVECR